MARSRVRWSMPRWILPIAAVASLFAMSAPARSGEDLDPEDDPSLKVPDVAAIDLATMAEGVDISDENWEAIEGELPQQLADGKLRAVLSATKGSEAIIAFALRPQIPLLINRATLFRAAKLVVAGGLMAIAAWPWRDRLIVLPVLLGALVYGALVLATGALTPYERERVRSFFGRLGSVGR